MSGVAVINSLLSASAALIAVVPAARIISGEAPQGTGIPLISIDMVSAVDGPMTVSRAEAKRFITERVQVSVLAFTYASQKSIMGLVRAALPLSRGAVAGFDVDSILPDSEGPDLFDSTEQVYTGSADYVVRYNR